jgi:replicative DNA helicase
MSNINNNKTFPDEPYENKLISAMLLDHYFAQQMFEVVDSKYFSQNATRVVYEQIKSFYEENQGIPSAEILATKAKRENAHDEALLYKIDSLFKKLSTLQLGDLNYVKKDSLQWCRKNRLFQALEECLHMADNAKYDAVVQKITSAVRDGSDRNFGHIYKDELEERMTERNRKPVATPWEVLNNIIGGGISGGELGVILALTGVGKSHALVDIGAAAAKAGLRVAHFTFELGEIRVGKRYDARLANVAHDDLPNHREKVEKAIAELGEGAINIKKYPNREASVVTLRNYVNRLVMENKKPDILIVDYADIMKSGKNYDNKRFEEEAVYEELRSLADELMIPIWTASQVNRSGMDVEVLTLKHIAECFAKANIADLFITKNRKKTSDYEALVSGNYETLGNMFVAKSRLGPDGVKFNILVNTALSRIKCLQPGSPEEEEAMITHDLKLETDAQRIRRHLNEKKDDNNARFDNKTNVVRLVPPQENSHT